MSTEQNKEIVRRFVEEIFVEGNESTVDELLADDFVAHTWPSTGKPKDDLKAAIGMTRKALADIRFSIDDLIAEDDRVAARLTTSARQVGEFMKMPASNKRYEISEIHIFRLAGGKVTEHWHQFDQMGMMQQLGAMPGKSSGSEPSKDASDGSGGGANGSGGGDAERAPGTTEPERATVSS